MTDQSNRRDFLKASAIAAAGLSATGGSLRQADGAPACCAAPKQAKLRLSTQGGKVPGESLEEQFDNMERWGFEAYEPGGWEFKGPDGMKKVKALKSKLKGRPIEISAVCAGFDGHLISPDKEVRNKAMTTMKQILDGAGELGSTGLIIVPAFNRQEMVPHQEAREMLTGFPRWDRRDQVDQSNALLAELGDHARKAGTRILLEPLNRDECYFLRTLAHGASICRDLQNPGIAMMGDFWHMTWEETSDWGAFLSAGDHLHHVHIASRRRRAVPGEDGDADVYIDGFRGLKQIGYQDFVSLECGVKGDAKKVIPACVNLLRKQWEQA
jgi:sugar phosphate isomerase/epimerase